MRFPQVTIMFTGIRGIMQMSLNEEQMLSVITRCGNPPMNYKDMVVGFSRC